MARSLNTSSTNIDFVEIFSGYCYIVCHDYSGAIIRSFYMNNSEVNVLKTNKYRVTCIEHVDVIEN